MANLWQALLAALISLNGSQHSICVFQLVRTMFVQPTTKNSGEIQQIAFFVVVEKGETFVYVFTM